MTAEGYQLPGGQRYLCLPIPNVTMDPEDQIFAAWNKHAPKIPAPVSFTYSNLVTILSPSSAPWGSSRDLQHQDGLSAGLVMFRSTGD